MAIKPIDVIVYRVDKTPAAEYAVYKMQFFSTDAKGKAKAAKKEQLWEKLATYFVEDDAHKYARKQLTRLQDAGYRVASYKNEYAAVREISPAVTAYGTELLPKKRKGRQQI